MTRQRFRTIVPVVLLLCLMPGLFPVSIFARPAGQSAPQADTPPPIVKELPPVGVPTEFAITPGQVHRFKVELKAGLAFRVNVRRKGVIISLLMYDAKDTALIQGECESGLDGEVPLVFIPKEDGVYQLSIESEGDPAVEKAYAWTMEAQRVPTEDDRAVMLLDEGIRLSQLGKFEPALKTLGTAVEELRKTGNRAMLAQGLIYESFSNLRLGRFQVGEALLKESLPLFKDLGYESGEQICYGNLAAICNYRQEYGAALEYGLKSLALFKKNKTVVLQLGITLNNLAYFYSQVGDYPKVIEKRLESITVFRTLRNAEFEASTLANLGDDYRYLKDFGKSVEYLEQAIAAFRKLGNRERIAATLLKLGAAYGENHQLEKAVPMTVEARQIFKELGNRRLEAVALNNQGRFLDDEGKSAEAVPLYLEALVLIRSTETKIEEIDFLTNLAAAERKTGDLENARKHIEAASAIMESVRSGLWDANNRAIFSGKAQSTYSGQSEIFQALHTAKPGQGYDLRALQVSEQARARTLVEQLSSRKTDLRAGVDRELLAKQTEAKKILDAKSQALGRTTEDPEKTKSLKAEVETALENYRLATRKLDEASPRYARAVRPSPLSLAQIQELIDSDTVLLEFGLAKDKSFLWVVTKSGLKTLDLPKSEDLQKLARQAYQSLTTQKEFIKFETPEKRAARLAEAEKRFSETTRTLSDLFFSPIAADIRGKKLVIVADGALLYLPFAALPFPGTGKPLVTECEISQLPSIATLSAIRADAANRPAPPKTLAVLADPVFAGTDERLKGTKPVTEPVPSDVQRSLRDIDGPDRSWPPLRLHFTRKEAEAISALVEPNQRRVQVDFPSSRQSALADDLGQYRFVHFATHGLANDRQPDLSGMVFSLVDEKGQPIDGFLHAYEVYNLKLPVDMVVLSGCRTGLGQEIQGEGLLGLTQAFLYAGASRVMVSLWNVQDESTSALMTDVYKGMLGPKKLRPSAALREAQLKMMKNPRWASPYYWAAFTIQGEPR